MSAIDFPHRARAEQGLDSIAADRPDSVHLFPTADWPRSFDAKKKLQPRLLPQLCSSSMVIAFCRLRRILLNDIDSDPISSLLLRIYSGVSSCPMLTLSAISEISATGLATSARNKKSTMMMVTTNVPARATINQNRA